MKTTKFWVQHFYENAKIQRVDWSNAPQLETQEKLNILSSLQAWQLGETSDGKNLLNAATKYATRINDPEYLEAVKLFIKEEQKHGENLGRYLDLIGAERINSDWGDSLFRKVRYFNTSMELWTLAVITVESTAQVFYQSLKEATACSLLKQICTDILIDEAYHIDFQNERLQILNQGQTKIMKECRAILYSIFYFFTINVVWFAHKKVFKASGLTWKHYMKKMKHKYLKIFVDCQETISSKLILSQNLI